MKIVEIIPSLNKVGGAEKFYCSLVEEIAKNNEVVCVVYFDDINQLFKEEFSKQNIKIITLGKKGGPDFKCAKRLKNILCILKPNIVHTHLGSILTYYLAFKYKRQKWELIHTVHSIPKKDSNFITNIIKKKYIKKEILKLVGITDSITKELNDCYGEKSSFTIQNGTNIIVKKSEIKKYDFVCVARFEEVKNHKLLFDAIKLLKENNNNVSLICVGDGSLLSQSKEYCKLNDINVVFTGFQNDVTTYLNQSKIFVLSSLYEGNPISILEAKFYGLPIIAPCVGGIPNIVNNGVDGILFEVNNAESLYKAMLKIMNPAVYKEYSCQSLKSSNNFTMTKCAESYVDLFNKLEGKL